MNYKIWNECNNGLISTFLFIITPYIYKQIFIKYLLYSKSWEYSNELDRQNPYTYGLYNPKG